jgi:FkbH-like protein
MWQTDWGAPPRADALSARPFETAVDPNGVEAAVLLFWEEHCVECAAPGCYQVCPLYQPRPDQQCARFRYGIFPNPAFAGLYDFGADVHFRRWGKLEAQLLFGVADPRALRQVAARNARALRIVQPVAGALSGVDPKRHLSRAYNRLRLKTFERWSDDVAGDAFEFVIEVYNPAQDPVSLIVESVKGGQPRFRAALPVQPGANLHRIPFTALGVDIADSGEPPARLLVYPDNDAEARLIFTWLDIVKYRVPVPSVAAPTLPAGVPKPASKVKCVVWDLDNTLWHGVLVEDGAERCVLRPEALDLIRTLDERGIIQSVVSKNDHAPAWSLIARHGLADYFVSPAINWGQKSQNLPRIAQELNINLDTFALIDDSPFERAEVRHHLPQVRTYSELEALDLLTRPEFDVPITEESKRRRLSYLAESKRREIAAEYSDDYGAFVKDCRMTAKLFTPREAKHVDRCLELLQRSNQLNLATHRYEREEFEALLADPAVLSIALACRDRFGDYGTVGFASVRMTSEVPILKDLVISCRIAKKKVENAWFRWLTEALGGLGFDRLHAWYLPTTRNGVLLDALREAGFVPVERLTEREVLALDFALAVPDGELVAVDAEAVDLPQPAGVGALAGCR